MALATFLGFSLPAWGLALWQVPPKGWREVLATALALAIYFLPAALALL